MMPTIMSGPVRAKLPCGRPAPIAPSVDERQLVIWKNQLKKHLEENDLKSTEQRWQIAKTILEAKGHFNTQALVKDVLAAHPGIGAATVYRNIKLLCDAKILRETMIDDEGNPVYEVFEAGHHDHIVCLDCNAIVEFSDGEIEDRQEIVLRDLKFSPVRHRHVLYARCEYR